MSSFKKFLTIEVLITIITGALLILFIDLYGRTNRHMHLILSIFFTIIYLFFIYKMANKNFDTMTVNLSAKVLPMILLTIIGVAFLKKKFNFYTILGILLILIGSIVISL
jgi:drug/metabolite transporter (DMT)-like permease